MAENPWGPGPRPEGRSPEWELLEKVALASIEEQRRRRRWGIFFKLTTLFYLFLLLILFFQPGKTGKGEFAGEHTAEVDVNGEIADDKEANAETIIDGLDAAFAAKNSRAVILRINSPGGSPVQSAYVYDEIRRLRAKYPNKKLYAVITDMGASGAYYMASAADQIYVSPASLVGSIGVIMQGFGVQGLMQKLGVDDRTMTAGTHKAIMSPFEPVSPEDKAHIQAMLDTIHQQFITAVKQGRGPRLKVGPDTFSGLFWTGQQAVDLGLADGFGSVKTVATDVIKAPDVQDYTQSPNTLDNVFKRMGVEMGSAVLARLEAGSEMRLK